MAEYTAESFATLEAALEDAKTKHAEAQKNIGIATDGDTNVWHDNPSFDEANRQEQNWRIRVRKLQAQVDQAVVVDITEAHARVQVGSHVIVDIDGDEETFVLAGQQNVLRHSSGGHLHLSQSSPLGSSLMGEEAGAQITYTLPSGKRQEATVVRVW